MGCVLVYVTYGSKEDAQRVVREVLRKRLIACANLFPITSMYWWKGRIEEGVEWVSLMKTREEYWERVRDEVARLHPYETPSILRIDAEGSGPFEAWLVAETKGA